MFELYPYQQELVDKARDSIVKGSKGVLIQSPPGSGKSVVIASVAKMATDKKNHVLFIVHRKELVVQIQETFSQMDVPEGFSTVMTVGKVVNRLDKLPYPSIIITDETHHSRAATYRKIYDHYSKAFRLGFTATPWRMSGKGFNDIYDDLVLGESVEWLIENEFLAPYEYYAPTLAEMDSLKKSSTGDFTKNSMDDAIKSAIFGDVVKHYEKLAKGKKTILYAHSIDASREIAESFKRAGISAIHADSKTPEKERDSIMDDFRSGKIEVLCNVDLVSEGFNVPDCSCVILVRPTASLVLFLQQAMRSMRYQKDKQATIIDHVGNYARHGLPDTERDWTIDDRPSNKKSSKSDNELPIKQCDFCHAISPAGSQVCEGCGEEFPVEQSEIETVDSELQQVNAMEFKVDYQSIRIKKEYGSKKVEDLETLEDFYLFAKSRGYKESWIKFKFKQFINIGWPEFYNHLGPLKSKYKNIFN